MESTGMYWKPVRHVLEGHLGLLLANPYHMHNIPGRKTDQNDAEWIADLLAHGLLKASFVPPQAIQELRNLTRCRVKLKQEHNRVHNRVGKVLEDANIKLGSVATDILGLSGRNIIRALIAGQTRPDRLADKAVSSLRKREEELELALRGDLNAHRRFLLKGLMDDLDRIGSNRRCRDWSARFCGAWGRTRSTWNGSTPFRGWIGLRPGRFWPNWATT